MNMMRRAMQMPKMAAAMVGICRYLTRKKPMMKSGRYFILPIMKIVVAKPRAGSMPPMTLKPVSSHAGMTFSMAVTKSAPK